MLFIYIGIAVLAAGASYIALESIGIGAAIVGGGLVLCAIGAYVGHRRSPTRL